MKPRTKMSSTFILFFISTLYFSVTCSSPTIRNPYDRRQTATTSSNTTSSLAPTLSSRKAGLGWPNGNTVDIRPFAFTGKISWYYTWSPWPISNPRHKIDLEFVPMMWGNRTVGEFQSTINDTIQNARWSSGYNKVSAALGMNEPEQPTQSNMTAAQGVDLWLEILEPLHAQGLRLGSPAVSSAPSGKVWLQDFIAGCNGRCTVDFVALHWYGTDANAFIAHLYDYWYTFNRTLWVTEWACQNFIDLSEQCSQEDVVYFMNKTQSFMDGADFVERYAWFGAMTNMQGVNQDNALMDSHGDVSLLGRQYINATSDEPLESSAMLGALVRTNLYIWILLVLRLSLALV